MKSLQKSFGENKQRSPACTCVQKDHIYIHVKIPCSPCQSLVVYGNTKIIQHALKLSLFKTLKLIIIILKYLQSMNLSNIKTVLGALYKIQI